MYSTNFTKKKIRKWYYCPTEVIKQNRKPEKYSKMFISLLLCVQRKGPISEKKNFFKYKKKI